MIRTIVRSTVWLLAVLINTGSGGQPLQDGRSAETAKPAHAATMDQKLLEGLEAGPAHVPASQTAARSGPSNDETQQPQGRTLNPFATGTSGRTENPLERISGQMTHVQQKLSGRDTSDATQTTQRQIVEELDELIAALVAQQQSQSQQQAAAKQNRGKEAPNKMGTDAARDGSDPAGEANSVEEQTATLRQTFEEVWGHLPERYRRQMQNAGSVEFLPQYRKLIEDYYKRLAEDRGGR